MTEKSELSYTAKDMLDDLKKEIQEKSEDLAKLWPERVQRYSHRQLSELWKKNPNYANNATYKSKKNPRYRISDKNLQILKKNVKKKLGSKSSQCQYKYLRKTPKK